MCSKFPYKEETCLSANKFRFYPCHVLDPKSLPSPSQIFSLLTFLTLNPYVSHYFFLLDQKSTYLHSKHTYQPKYARTHPNHHQHPVEEKRPTSFQKFPRKAWGPWKCLTEVIVERVCKELV